MTFPMFAGLAFLSSSPDSRDLLQLEYTSDKGMNGTPTHHLLTIHLAQVLHQNQLAIKRPRTDHRDGKSLGRRATTITQM